MYAYPGAGFFFLKWHHRGQQLGLGEHRHQIEFGPSTVKLDLVELVYQYQFLLPPSCFRGCQFTVGLHGAIEWFWAVGAGSDLLRLEFMPQLQLLSWWLFQASSWWLFRAGDYFKLVIISSIELVIISCDFLKNSRSWPIPETSWWLFRNGDLPETVEILTGPWDGTTEVP